jgi:nucleotide-binding universal stress UspA family protein
MAQDKSPVVVVGVDGSSDAEAALRWADRYATAAGASLRVVVAWQWAMSYGYPMMFDGYAPDQDARAVAEKAVAELSLPSDRVTIETYEGSAGDVLVQASEGADLLVVGRHGHRVVSTLLLGSVSNHCVHHAKVPVVVVR